MKRQFRLGAVLTETAAEGFLLASVQSDDTPLFVTLNRVAMTRPMHRHIARGPHKKSAVLENTARSLIVAYWPSDPMAVAATPFTILTSMGRHTTGMDRGLLLAHSGRCPWMRAVPLKNCASTRPETAPGDRG